MSQRHAAWNYVVQLAPVVLGAGLLLVTTLARRLPAVLFFVMLSSYSVGFILFLVAKASLFRQGVYFSWGSNPMSLWNRRAYRAGYALMLLGCVGALAFIIAWR
jgi:formate/nitrite transporter FocA (FNT family)